MTVPIASGAVFLFIAASVLYVYRFRGRTRYADFGEYVSKGWPIFSPLNCLLYLFTQRRGRRAIVNLDEFPELDAIQEAWPTIAREAEALYRNQYFDQTTDPDSDAYYDIGFRTFYKYGWSKFYLSWYGTVHESARRLCPETVRILESVPCVNGAMFSVLPPGGKLTRHCDPVACSMRYHLGLSTPNDDACYINIDGTDYSWRDGAAMMFDETYLHYAHNDADTPRLILMCDVERPTWLVGSIANFCYKGLMRLTVVPNMAGDRRGLVNSIFAGIAPLLARTKALKETNRGRYKAIKYSVNGTLALLVSGLLFGAVALAAELFG